ncbi:MAG: PEP-CTERM sorting domain-containing protein [Bryobacteraceae bacterium]|nr:PEP-CTERM sorting domain-containing protein [Bryobacteraceae bacterium]
MHLDKLAIFVMLGGLLSLPASADSFLTFNQPTDGSYLSSTTNYGGGDGSGAATGSLGVFTFSSSLQQNSVPGSWSTWSCPPASESCTPNILWNTGNSSLTLTLTGQNATAGFELEPDEFQAESVTASFYNQSDALIGAITLVPNGSNGALLFALQDTTSGSWIGSIQITDAAGDDFALAQLRAGGGATPIPEPATMLLVGGCLVAVSVFRRKLVR